MPFSPFSHLRTPRGHDAWGVVVRAVALVLVTLGVFLSRPAAVGAIQPHAAADLQQRAEAMRDLASARQEVATAKAEARRTRQALDDFLAGHFERQRSMSSGPAEVSESELAERAQIRAELESKLAALRAKRTMLLETLTEEHPEVVEVALQIENAQRRLEEEVAGSLNKSGKTLSSVASGDGDAENYQRLFGDWQAAQQRLESAGLAESAAADRLAAVASLAFPHGPQEMPFASHSTPAPDYAPPEADHPATVVAEPAQEIISAAQQQPTIVGADDAERASRTQTLALAALALAVMLAALAAIRLARATSDPLFASADEVAAALAIPVVGIVPYGARSTTAHNPGMKRSLSMIGQIALALAVFCAVAFAIVHLGEIVELIRDPVGRCRGWMGL